MQKNNINNFQLAQISVARMKDVNIADTMMKEFSNNPSTVNKVAERAMDLSEGIKEDGPFLLNAATIITSYCKATNFTFC